MARKKGWKRSQTSSGFYHKEKGKVPSFIKFEVDEINENGKYKNKYSVIYKKGLGDRPHKILGIFNNRKEARAYAKKWMKEHPNG